MPDPKPMLRASEVAERYGMTIRFVRQLATERRIPFYKVSSRLNLFDPDELDIWFAERRVETVDS